MNNPLDPENPDNKIYLLEGKLNTSTKTPGPLKDASVLWKAENLQVFTDDNGYFKIRCSNRVDGWIVFVKPGFSSDSLFISWGKTKKHFLEARLNILPVLTSVSFYSVVKNKYSQPEHQLVIEAQIKDDDDDIDSVYLVCEELNITKKLNKISASSFTGRFSIFDLSISSLEEAIGREFSVSIKDSGNNFYSVGSGQIKRVINQIIEFISPSNQDTVTSTPLLRWKKFTPGFEFTYTIEIYTDEPEPKLEWKKELLNSDEIQAAVDTPLQVVGSNDRFYWVIWCIDEFNNRSRSKPASFIVK